MCIAALFLVAEIGNQWKGPSIDDWVKMWYKRMRQCYPVILSFVTGMDLENIRLSKVSQTEKVKDHVVSLVCAKEN